MTNFELMVEKQKEAGLIKNTDKQLIYVSLALAEETLEYCSEIDNSEEKINELADVMWYLNALCLRYGSDLKKHFQALETIRPLLPPNSNQREKNKYLTIFNKILQGCVANMVGYVKKSLRSTGFINPVFTEKIDFEIYTTANVFYAICQIYEVDLEHLAKIPLEKIEERGPYHVKYIQKDERA